MKKALRKEIIAETYKDVERLIIQIVWRFWRTYGGDLDDLMGQANLIFIAALDSYNSNRRTKLSTWIAFKIKRGLYDYMRQGNGYKPTTRIDDDFVEKFPATNKNFSVMELLDEMEQDAYIVLQLFLETPRDVMVNILNKNGRIDHVQSAVQNRLRNRLRQMGWTVKRIRKAFEELKNATSY